MPSGDIHRFLFLGILCMGICRSSRGDENQPVSIDFAKRLWNDITELPGLPSQFSKTQWEIAGGVTAATLAALAVDGEIREVSNKRRNEFSAAMSRTSTHFGDYKYQMPLQIGSWALGTAFNYTPLKKSAADGMEASLFAAGIVTPIITRITGRALPNYNERPMNFQFFEKSPGHESFPSGHTTEAFAMAAVLDANFRSEFGHWQTPFLFALASATGASRIYDGKHFLSDVILGAAIGTSMGYWIADKPRNQSQSAVTVMPTLNGVRVAWQF